VSAPSGSPHHLFHFLFHGRSDGGIADIGVDLGEEIAADRHRLELGVIDVGRDDGAAAGHFIADEFRRDEERHRSAEALAVVMAFLGDVEHNLRPRFSRSAT